MKIQAGNSASCILETLSAWAPCLAIIFSTIAVAGPTEDLFEAAHRGDFEFVQTLLSKGTDINARMGNGATPLMMAAEGGKRNVVEALIDRGAEVNAKMSGGFTPLMLAARKGHIEAMSMSYER